jgi:hypothetical protein
MMVLVDEIRTKTGYNLFSKNDRKFEVFFASVYFIEMLIHDDSSIQSNLFPAQVLVESLLQVDKVF